MSETRETIRDEAERLSARWQALFWALPSGPMRSKLRALEIDHGRLLTSHADLLAACKLALETGADDAAERERRRDIVRAAIARAEAPAQETR